MRESFVIFSSRNAWWPGIICGKYVYNIVYLFYVINTSRFSSLAYRRFNKIYFLFRRQRRWWKRLFKIRSTPVKFLEKNASASLFGRFSRNIPSACVVIIFCSNFKRKVDARDYSMEYVLRKILFSYSFFPLFSSLWSKWHALFTTVPFLFFRK